MNHKIKDCTLKSILLFILGCIYLSPLEAQKEVHQFELKKGEVLDVLFSTFQEDSDVKRKRYMKSALPVAKRLSYETLTIVNIDRRTRGNLEPNSLIFGKWESLDAKHTFADVILKEVPDFHEQRRELWKYIAIGYVEMKEDVVFELDENKFNVVTSFWTDQDQIETEYLSKWQSQLEKYGGNAVLKMDNLQSPYGYPYDPQHLYITSWSSESQFNTFSERIAHFDSSELKYVQEYILE